MVKALFGVLIVFLVVIIVLTCVCYWLFNYATLEKLGYADVEIAQRRKGIYICKRFRY